MKDWRISLLQKASRADRGPHHVNRGINNAHSDGCRLDPQMLNKASRVLSPLLIYHLQTLEVALKGDQYSRQLFLPTRMKCAHRRRKTQIWYLFDTSNKAPHHISNFFHILYVHRRTTASSICLRWLCADGATNCIEMYFKALAKNQNLTSSPCVWKLNTSEAMSLHLFMKLLSSFPRHALYKVIITAKVLLPTE